MVIDTSALIAILLQEADATAFSLAIEKGWPRPLSAANYVEASMVLSSRVGRIGIQDFDRFRHTSDIRIVPVDFDHAHRAREAYRRFGKGNHKAGLNFGDCFAFALAEAMGEPLLYKGNDFPVTGIPAVDVPAR